MAIQDRTTLESYFETGDKPSQAQFKDLIDSCFNLDEDFVNNSDTLFVSKNGNDSTAVIGNSLRPYLTITAAKAAASTGNLIYVNPGTYDEKNLLKNGVNYYFSPGSIVLYTGSVDGAIFDDSSTGSSGQVTCKITGSGIFNRQGSGNGSSYKTTIYTEELNTDIYIEAYSLQGNLTTIYQTKGNLFCRIKTSIVSDNDTSIYNLSGCTATVYCHSVFGIFGVYAIGGEITIYSDQIICTGANSQSLVSSSGGQIYAFVSLLQSDDVSGKTISVSGSSTLYLYNCHIENTSTGAASTISFTSGILELYSCNIVSNGTIESCFIRLGTCRFENCTLSNSGNNSNSHCIKLEASPDCVLNNVSLFVTNITANSVYSASAENLLVYQGVSNHPVNANVTELVNNLTIDANVI